MRASLGCCNSLYLPSFTPNNTSEQHFRVCTATPVRCYCLCAVNTQSGQPDQPTVYEIKLCGQLDNQWSEWFGGAFIAIQDDGDTILTCTVSDQAALHGLLKKVRDLGIPLLSVMRVDSGLDQIKKEKNERQ